MENIHRDGYHLTRAVGRYAIGLLWYRLLTGVSVAGNSFDAFDEQISEEEQALAKACVDGYMPL